MGPDKRNHFLIACRYVSHDHWFLTNTSPSWKIKHLKQSIVAKALNLPFDRRLLMENSTGCPPSPITFAPIEGFRESEFAAGLGTYEADKIQADCRMRGHGSEGGILINDLSLAGIPGCPPDASTTLQSDTEGAVPIVEPSFAEYKEQNSTSAFTLIRFSTGQILEEHFFVSWYNLGQHELVELHCSSPPTTFSRALVFGHMLMNGGSITVDVPTSTTLGLHKPSNATSDRHASSYLAPSAVSSRTATLSLELAEPLRLTSLPRQDLASYIEPYWEGWVRILRVIWQSDLDRSITSAHGSTLPQTNVFDSCADNGLNEKRTKLKEWKERWAIIRNGVLSLGKNRDDPTCTRLPLSSLVSLCGPEYFSAGHSDSAQLSTNLPGGGPGGNNHNHPLPSHPNPPPTIRTPIIASISDPSLVTRPVEDVGAKRYMSTATSNSATAARVLSPLLTQSNPTRVGANKNPPLLATPRDPAFSDNDMLLLPTDPERSRCERAAVREWERERMLKETAEMARLDKQVEFNRWDDFVVFGGKNKARSKEKEKVRENEKDASRSGKVREEKEQKTRKNIATVSVRHALIGEGRPEKDNDRNREDRQRGKLQDHQDHFSHPDDRYIPASREEAIANGMLIVCAKFRIGVLEDTNKVRHKDESCDRSLLRDIGLDVSIASKGDESEEGDRRRSERNAEWHRPQALESSPVMKSLPPPRKASLPGLGHGLTLLTSGGNMTPGGSMFGGLFGNKERDNDKLEKSYKQEGSHLDDEEKTKQHRPGDSVRSPSTGLPTLRGELDDYYVDLSIKPPDMNDLKRLDLSVDTATLAKNAAVCPALPSPNDPNDCRLDEGQDDRGEHYRPRYGCGNEHTNQQAHIEGKRRKNEDRVEWVVMDLGTDIAYNSFLRILHRHFPLPMQSSFVQMSPTLFQPPSPNPSHRFVPDIHGALPYPEWRRGVVLRARSQGMRELGRPLELSFKMYGWDTQAAKPPKVPNGPGDAACWNENGRRESNVSETDHGSDDDHDNTCGIDHLLLDDSGDESEDESARWWQDIPRQSSSEGRLEWSTTGHRHSSSGPEEIWEEYSPSSPTLPFADPFTSHSAFSEPILRSPVLGLDMEERLRSSISSSTLASNNTSSSMSLRSMTVGASSSGERTAESSTGMRWQHSPNSYYSRSYPRRIVSPSQTLSSPSSNESLGPYHRPPRPFSPNSNIYLPNGYHQPSGPPSVLHHSASMPNASTWRSAGGGMQTEMIRDPNVLHNLQKPILSPTQIHRIEADVDQFASIAPQDDPLPYDNFSANTGVFDRSILTLAQIHQIETDTEKGIRRDYTRLTQDTPSFGITDSTTTKRTLMSNESSPSSILQQLANDGYDKNGDDAGLEQDLRSEKPRDVAMCLDDFERGDGLAKNNVTRRFIGATRTHPTPSTSSTLSFRDYDYMGNAPTVSDSASISANAILRKVRSGSSLQTPMGVHFEESEEEGGAEI